MNMFDVLLARRMNSAPLPQNAHLATAITSQPVTDASDYPLPKCDVTVTDADKCEVIVTDDGIITEDSVPYNYRQSAGGDTELDELVGGTVAWNQLVENGNFESSSRWQSIGATLDISNNSANVTIGTAVSADTQGIYITNLLSPSIENHVVVVRTKYKPSVSTHVTFSIYNSADGHSRLDAVQINANITSDVESLWKIGSRTTQSNFYVYVNRNKEMNEGDTITIKDVQIIDLTLMFGSTIADYIYSLEQTTAGAGAAWLKEHFPKLFDDGYKAYNAGELVSVKTSAHVMKDSNDEIIGSYPLSPVELRGLYKLDANNKLYCDGDSYRCDGRVKRRYGIVDLGTLEWAYIGSALAFSASVTNIKPTVDVSTKANAICSKYQVITRNERENGGLVVIWAQSEAAGKIYVYDSAYSDAATFKTAMSGVMLVYELATPTEELTSPFEKNQAVDAGGTEEYIDDRSVSVPIGHSTKYYNGKAYTKYFAQKSGVVSMADEGIMPMTPMYISANGEIDAEYWR